MSDERRQRTPAELERDWKVAVYKELRRIADALERAHPPPAPVVDLDGKRGDPEVRFEPRGWNGAPFKGRKYSDCPPDYLELVAKALDHFAANPKPDADPKKAQYDRLDAARARGWAARKRNGWAPNPPSPAPGWEKPDLRTSSAPASDVPFRTDDLEDEDVNEPL